jgi:O-antigen ligase
MLKRISIEKGYILLVILILGVWGGMNLVSMEINFNEAQETAIQKLLVGAIFLLTSAYVALNRYIKVNLIGILVCLLSFIFAVYRFLMLPPSLKVVSYFYQPMRDLIFASMFLFVIALARKSEELYNFFTSWFILAVLIMAFFYAKNWMSLNFNTNDEAHLCSSYIFLMVLPILLYNPHKWSHYLGFLIAGVAVFASFKRGGILAFVLASIAFLVVKELFIGRKFSKLIYLIVALILFAAVIWTVDNFMDNVISTRFLNIADDGGSNRDVVWSATWNMIKESDIDQLLFGHGYCTVILDSPEGFSAHNDFLEVIYDFGLFSFLLYVVLHIALIRQIFRNIRLHNPDAAIMSFSYVVFFVVSMVSIIVLYFWFGFMALSWGLGCVSEEKLLK